MPVVQQLEFDLWTALKNASEDPIAAEFPVIWQALEAMMMDLTVGAQLEIAAQTIEQVTDIFQVQAGCLFEALDASAIREGPTMGADAFDRYVRQSMDIDFEDYLEPIAPFPRSPQREIPESQADPTEAFYSLAQSIDKTELLEVLHQEIQLTEMQTQLKTDSQIYLKTQEQIQEQIQAATLSIAHDEDIEAWISAIQTQLRPLNDPIEFQALLNQINLSWVELWLGLLLGDYTLMRLGDRREAQAFYSVTGLWIQV